MSLLTTQQISDIITSSNKCECVCDNEVYSYHEFEGSLDGYSYGCIVVLNIDATVAEITEALEDHFETIEYTGVKPGTTKTEIDLS